ncbi:MAG: hypothetical protein AAF492_14730, partial [Verrucomicrobiota bacterium]
MKTYLKLLFIGLTAFAFTAGLSQIGTAKPKKGKKQKKAKTEAPTTCVHSSAHWRKLTRTRKEASKIPDLLLGCDERKTP